MDLRKKLEHVSGADIEAIIDDLAALKRDVAKALDHLKHLSLDDTVDAARDFADDVGDEMNGLYKDVAKKGRRTAKAVGRHVEDQPITSLLIAFSAGFVMSKLFSRSSH